MHVGKTLFAQVMEFVPWTSFARIAQRHGGNAGVRTLSRAAQFRAMAFAQLTWRESLRDIEVSLSANSTKLYAMEFRSAVKRSTLADANESRDWRIWSDLAAVLNCRVPCDHVPVRSWPLFRAREILPALIAALRQGHKS